MRASPIPLPLLRHAALTLTAIGLGMTVGGTAVAAPGPPATAPPAPRAEAAPALNGLIDPALAVTPDGAPVPPTSPERDPERTVWAFQPRELPGTVLTSPVVVRVHSFRAGEAGDFDPGMPGGPTINARGEVYGINSRMTSPLWGQNFNVITDTGMLREFLGLDGPAPRSQPATPAERADSGVDSVGGAISGWSHLLTGLVGALLAWLIGWLRLRAGNGGRTPVAG